MAAKVKYNQLRDYEKKKFFGDFYKMVSLLRNVDEVKNFFKDLFTPGEMVMVSKRIQIAQMLLEGKTHEEIISKLNAGSSTINYVSSWLENGFSGYKDAIKKFNKNKESAQIKQELDPMSFEAFRKKRPAHYLLLNLFLDKISKK